MILIPADIGNHSSHVHPDQFLQHNRPDKVRRTASRIAAVVGANKVVLPLLKIAGGAVPHLCATIGTVDHTGKQAALAGSRPAVALLADWAMFDPTGPRLHRMEIDILPENKRSRAVARKVGATLEGVRRAYMYVNDQWRDHESYVLMAEDAPNGFTARLMTGNSPS